MRKFFSFTFVCAFSVNVCFSATIENANFTASADSTIAGSFSFALPSNGVADLGNVIAFNATSTAVDYFLVGPSPQTVVVPAATYTLADLSNFSYGPFPGCGEGGNPLFANVICELLEASFSGPQQQFTSLIVDIDPAGRIVEGLASYAPIPNQPGVHGFVTSFTVTAATVPEPSTSFYVGTVAVCLLLMGTLRAAHHVVIPPRSDGPPAEFARRGGLTGLGISGNGRHGRGGRTDRRALSLNRNFRPALQMHLRRELTNENHTSAEETTRELSKLSDKQT